MTAQNFGFRPPLPGSVALLDTELEFGLRVVTGHLFSASVAVPVSASMTWLRRDRFGR
jgi:hypothetical protein